MKQAIKFTLVAAAMTVLLAGCGKTEDAGPKPSPSVDASECDKLPDPKPKGEGAAAAGAAAAEGIAARDACKKALADLSSSEISDPNKDLARLRELAEKDDARNMSAEERRKKSAEGFVKGASEPLIEFKY